MFHDLVRASGRITDGCGNLWFWGDLAIQGSRIAECAPRGTLQGRETLDVQGRFIAPGFVDVHTHSDLVNRRAESVVRQGVTTEVIGNCGMPPAPLGEEHLGEARQAWGRISDQPEVTWGWRTFAQYLQVLERGGLAINLASLAGHGALRVAAMGLDEREPTSSVLARMKELLSEAMESGAFGLSTGLVYPPGCYAHTEEIVALCRVVADYGGLYASHIRGELTDRGVLRQGARADIVVVDLARIRDRATNPYPHAYPFENYPHQYSEGIDYVFVNGVLVIKGERHSGALPGKVLRRRADGGRRRAMQTVNQEAKR